jgi:hypothetical protein
MLNFEFLNLPLSIFLSINFFYNQIENEVEPFLDNATWLSNATILCWSNSSFWEYYLYLSM